MGTIPELQIRSRASLLNRVERFFLDITDKRIRYGVFISVAELVDGLPKRGHRTFCATARRTLRSITRSPAGYAPRLFDPSAEPRFDFAGTVDAWRGVGLLAKAAQFLNS